MSALVVTTMSAQGYDRYGRRMLASMHAKLDPAITLRLYSEGFTPAPAVIRDHWQVMDLNEQAAWLPDFKAWCDADPVRCGRFSGVYDMRQDARRFSHKVAAFTHAALGTARRAFDLMIWCDADVIAHEAITMDWLHGLMRDVDYLAWLDRRDLYPECGFFIVRPLHPAHDVVWREVLSLYTTRSLLQHHEWHDSYLIQQVMERAQRDGLLGIGSLSGAKGARTSHPLVNGPLGERLDHLKGPRKDMARTPDRDLRVPRGEAYWRK